MGCIGKTCFGLVGVRILTVMSKIEVRRSVLEINSCQGATDSPTTQMFEGPAACSRRAQGQEYLYVYGMHAHCTITVISVLFTLSLSVAA
jgi:hypothetical protein